MKKRHLEELKASIVEAGQILKGRKKPSRVFSYTPIDVKRIREKKFKKSQSDFAALLGLSIDTLQDWEQGRRRPSGPARALLVIASKHPKLVKEALAG